MNAPVILLCLCAFALLGALPFTVFRRGRLNGAWWLTAAPFFLDAALLVAALAGLLTPVPLRAQHAAALSFAAVPLAACAIALTGCTIGVHHIRVSLWHQDNDAPDRLVTYGPYSRIRHPFYASFILMLAAAAAALPHPGSLALLIFGTLQLQRTARREERRLLASAFAAEYASYMQHTGRFLPLPRPAAHASGPAASTAGSHSPAATRHADRS